MRIQIALRCIPTALFLLAVPGLGPAQTGLEELEKWIAPAGSPGDDFGDAAAVDGDVAVVGAVGESAAYVFVREPGGWVLEERLQPPVSHWNFGFAVDADGDRVLVSDDLADGPGGFQLVGAAYVFLRTGAGWVHEGTLSHGIIHDHVGDSVAIDDEWAALGVGNPLTTYACHLFRRGPSGWSYSTSVEVWPASLSLDGGVLVAGDDHSTSQPGRAKVFLYNGTHWVLDAVLSASDGSPGDNFGRSVAVHGTSILVGAPYGPGGGAAYAFRRVPSGWQQLQKLMAFDAPAGGFGISVDLEASWGVIGASTAQDQGVNTGAAYLYRDLDAGWTPIAKLRASDGAGLDLVGQSVGVSRGVVVAGAPRGDGVAGNTGAAYRFELPQGSSFCAGDGSASPCPCGNPGAAGQGCANSSGAGAELEGHGTGSVALDDLTFFARGLLPAQPALLFAGANAVQGGNGAGFGDGLRCAGGDVVRLGTVQPDAAGLAGWGPGLIAAGGWSAGETRRFQVWYRDPAGGPCGTGFNLSNGWEIELRP